MHLRYNKKKIKLKSGDVMGYGDGSYYQRQDTKKWVAKFKGKTYSCESKTAAEKKLKALRQAEKMNRPQIKSKMTVKELMEIWLHTFLIDELKPGSFDRKENTCKYQIYPYIGDMQVSGLCTDDISNLLKTLKKKGLSYSTIKKAYEAVNGCIKYFVDIGDLPYNPIAGMKVPSANKKSISDIVYYTEEEIEKIYIETNRLYLNGSRVYKQGDAITVLANTGMRIGELLALTWNDIDFENKIIHINGNRVMVKNRDNSNEKKNKSIDQNSAKTFSGVRVVPINNKALSALKNLKSINGDSEKILVSSKGRPLTIHEIDRMFRRILRNCKFDEEKIYGVHSLRHSFATIAISKGADIKKVSEILGHKDVYVTYNIYVHFIPKDLQSTVDLLD